MGYSKCEFKQLRELFQVALIDDNGEPLSCQLHEHPEATGRISFVSDTGTEIVSHVAEACNIADIISSIDRLLSMPRSEIACEELSETMLLRLDVLREYISSAFKNSQRNQYQESDADLLIRRWAGFLKHPSEYVFAHRCLSSWGVNFDKPPICINTNFLAQWDELKPKQKDRKKSELANEVVSVELPSANDIEPFFTACADHLKCLLNHSPA